jgi:hypothetical protein
MRFMHRYADEHGFSYGETSPEPVITSEGTAEA